MQDTIDAQLDDVDLAVAAYRRAGEWVVDELTLEHCEDVETLAEALRHLGGDAGAIALVSIDEDFFVIVRVQGPRTRVLLSDASAAEDWDLAESVLDLLDESQIQEHLNAIEWEDEQPDHPSEIPISGPGPPSGSLPDARVSGLR